MAGPVRPQEEPVTVYVDPAVWPFGRMIMCHMFADTTEELLAMADRIGVQRKWLQRPPETGLQGMDASWVHFDIATAKRALAVRYGAVEVGKFFPIWWMAARNGDVAGMERIESLPGALTGNLWLSI
jgi:hypothetical protein